MYCFTKVFLFHKPNIRGNSWILTNSHQPHPHYRVKLNNCFRFQWHFWRCKFSPFFGVLYNVTLYTFVASFPIHGLACTGTTLNMNKEIMLSAALGFPIAKEPLAIASIWYQRAQVFPESRCHQEFNASRKEMSK